MTQASETNKLVQKIVRLLDDVFWEIHPMLPREWHAQNLTMPEFKLIIVLFGRETLRMGNIADELNVTLATASGVVNRMVEQGFVTRERSSDDRRIVFCQLSMKGKRFIESYQELYNNRIADLLKGLTAHELQTAGETVEALLRTREKAGSPDKKKRKPKGKRVL